MRALVVVKEFVIGQVLGDLLDGQRAIVEVPEFDPCGVIRAFDATIALYRRLHPNRRNWSNWCRRLDEVFVRINGERHYLWRAVDHEAEVLEVIVTKRRDCQVSLKFLRRTMKRYGRPWSIVTDWLRSYSAAMKALGGTVKLTDFLEVPLIDMPPKSLICRVGSN